MRAPTTRRQDAILQFMASNCARYAAPLDSGDSKPWRRAKRYATPCVYLWEIGAHIYGRPLNGAIAKHASTQRRRLDVVGTGAHRAGSEQAFRFELSQRYRIYADGPQYTTPGMEQDLAALETRGLIRVDRPVAHLTRRGADVAASLSAQVAA